MLIITTKTKLKGLEYELTVQVKQDDDEIEFTFSNSILKYRQVKRVYMLTVYGGEYVDDSKLGFEGDGRCEDRFWIGTAGRQELEDVQEVQNVDVMLALICFGDVDVAQALKTELIKDTGIEF